MFFACTANGIESQQSTVVKAFSRAGVELQTYWRGLRDACEMPGLRSKFQVVAIARYGSSLFVAVQKSTLGYLITYNVATGEPKIRSGKDSSGKTLADSHFVINGRC